MLFAKQPIGTKHYSEMTNQEIRDELAVMLKALRASYKAKNWNWNDDFVRESKQLPIKHKNGIDTLQFVYSEINACISLATIKDIQEQHNLKDTDSICVTSGEDYDGCIETVLVFMTEVQENDLQYYSRIKELYLDTVEQDNVHKFISDIKKSTGIDTPYYAAKKMLEIFKANKGDYLA